MDQERTQAKHHRFGDPTLRAWLQNDKNHQLAIPIMDKKELRAHIKALKKQHTKEQLLEQSEMILAKLEQHPDFVKAEKVMLYSALPDEVQTQAFLEKWHLKKQIILPTVVGDDIIPVEYAKDTDFAVGDFNILEPYP